MAIENIVIAGAGTMGYSMAQIFARYNYHVTIYDLKEEALETAKRELKKIHKFYYKKMKSQMIKKKKFINI